MTKSKLSFCNENQLIQEEKERLRKLRIIQVDNSRILIDFNRINIILI